ncbi:hypothetical protein AQ771_04950 [Burkholderia pseudomallei]|nr:hypothetical protein AQ841_07440 [Burkholderia pseudomallei]OMU14033.1 hypothetical protein AQ771_04950 [Burkholderia pseudomallei]OMU23805.1 hypothetical protein AQ772_03020 [Burkholderia pseudomallei]OMU34327.1 hypothetical protein AQ774_07500 [Burkholderia pseudomallei]OMU51635.1 hypothetical protein AQ775_15305 [Burkholderia pseudomallei]
MHGKEYWIIQVVLDAVLKPGNFHPFGVRLPCVSIYQTIYPWIPGLSETSNYVPHSFATTILLLAHWDEFERDFRNELLFMREVDLLIKLRIAFTFYKDLPAVFVSNA